MSAPNEGTARLRRQRPRSAASGADKASPCGHSTGLARTLLAPLSLCKVSEDAPPSSQRPSLALSPSLSLSPNAHLLSAWALPISPAVCLATTTSSHHPPAAELSHWPPKRRGPISRPNNERPPVHLAPLPARRLPNSSTTATKVCPFLAPARRPLLRFRRRRRQGAGRISKLGVGPPLAARRSPLVPRRALSTSRLSSSTSARIISRAC